MLEIRKAKPKDAKTLLDLYRNHLAKQPPEEFGDLEIFRNKIAKLEAEPLYHVLVGELKGQLVSTVTLIVIENLTYNMRPYAIIENVVTHAGFRNKGYAAALMAKASEIAASFNCYKIMLLSGSKKEETLRFYENYGFDRHEKTGFIKRL